MIRPRLNSLQKRAVASTAVVVWLFGVMVAYYVIHKPLSVDGLLTISEALGKVGAGSVGEMVGALGDVAGDAVTVWVVVALGAVLGFWLVKRWEFGSSLEVLVMATGIGLGALGLIGLGLALLGVVNQWVYWGLVVLGFVLLWNEGRAVWKTLRAISLLRETRGDTALAWFCVLTLVLTFLFALVPPWGWDGIQYHLVTPKLVIENGRMVVPPDNLSLNNPNLVEMLFLVGMVLKGDGATQGLHWIFLPLTVGAILVFGARYFSWRTAWLASALFCAVPTVALLSTWAYNDLALTFFTFTAFAMALRAKETGRLRDFVFVGVLCGFAFGEKVTAFFVPAALAVILFRPRMETLKNIALMGLVAGLLAAPWWIRNLVFVGNPVYPFAFGGRYWDAWRTAWYTRFGSGLIQRPWELLWVPWTVTVFGVEGGTFQVNVGALLLALLPLNLIRETTENREQITDNRRHITDNGQQTADSRQQTTDNRREITETSKEGWVVGTLDGGDPSTTPGTERQAPLRMTPSPRGIERQSLLRMTTTAQDDEGQPPLRMTRAAQGDEGHAPLRMTTQTVLRAMWFFAGVLYVGWLVGVAQSTLLWQGRLLVPAFPVLCLLAARGLGQLKELELPKFSVQRFASILVGFVLGLTALAYTVAFLSDNALGYFFGGVTRAEYLTAVLGHYYEMAEWAKVNLPAEAKVQFLWETRAYYFDERVEADAILDRFPHLVYLYGDARGISDELRREGFTHVLLYREGLDNLLQTGEDPISERDMQVLGDMLKGETTPVYGRVDLGLETREARPGLANAQDEPYAVYELKAQ